MIKENNVLIKPPLGLKPKYLMIQERRDEIFAACLRYIEVRKKIPQEWKDEFDSYNNSMYEK